jgi:hypothetical protein
VEKKSGKGRVEGAFVCSFVCLFVCLMMFDDVYVELEAGAYAQGKYNRGQFSLV